MSDQISCGLELEVKGCADVLRRIVKAYIWIFWIYFGYIWTCVNQCVDII